VKDNALSMNLAYELEFYRVVFHGMLHLCGYKDKNKEDVVVMREKEDFYIQWFVSRETNTI
jgi:rRNA maturation RNase YbeY